MHFPHGPGGFGMFGGILESIVAGLFFLICLVIVVGLLVVLVRFLLVATKAAEIYVAKNQPTETATPATTTPAVTTPVATAPASTTAATKPLGTTATTPRSRTTPKRDV
jgi:cytoskeletal protein RodZ